ncbi:MAG TPA: HEPN domain-containing protein [Flavobacteriales bacterium]|nr:HEPN domain-containing protein [Flavobacteriales bacterium]
MQSFRHELEDLNNPVVEKDIIELERKIRLFREGKIDEEKFRSLRLARGVYGQRQPGVQMIRIKIPYGKLNVAQLRRIADVADEYSNGNLHTTTRQDIQIHYVSLDRTPQLWADLEKDAITLREACGNTVRNITASYLAGIDPNEVFDVSPYAHALFDYFLRHPVGQELGRKFKIAFSSGEKDDAFTFMHDLGFIPKVIIENGEEQRGFKVVLGGGLGAHPVLAKTAFEFLHEDQIIPFTEGVIRVFDRHGERARRHKARIKFLIEEIGLEKFLTLVKEEQKALRVQSFKIDRHKVPVAVLPKNKKAPHVEDLDIDAYDAWLKTNVIEQKQRGYFAVKIRLSTGDFSTTAARQLASLVEDFAGDDIRITINQGLLLKFILPENLPFVFHQLNAIGLAEPGFDSALDITSCPGTDTCNLGITSSYGITRELERVIKSEYPELIYNNDIKIRISGCMNSCGQHTIANIGFHGSTLKSGQLVVPALQVLLGGGPLGNGEGKISDKVIKVPAKRGPAVLRTLLNDYEEYSEEQEYFNAYYERKGEKYFYDLLKPLASTETILPEELIDWGHDETYKQAIGVGECAGVAIDLVATMLFETEEKLLSAKESFEEGRFADSIYFSYSTLVSGAKAWLVNHGIKTNSQHGIIKDFEIHAEDTFFAGQSFSSIAFAIRDREPDQQFAASYLEQALQFFDQLKQLRQPQIAAQLN